MFSTPPSSCLYFSRFSQMSYMAYPTDPLPFSTTKQHTQFSPASCDFLSLTLQYSPQYPLLSFLNHPPSTFFLSGERPNSIRQVIIIIFQLLSYNTGSLDSVVDIVTSYGWAVQGSNTSEIFSSPKLSRRAWGTTQPPTTFKLRISGATPRLHVSAFSVIFTDTIQYYTILTSESALAISAQYEICMAPPASPS